MTYPPPPTDSRSLAAALAALRDSPAWQRLQAIAQQRRPFNFFNIASLPRREDVHSGLLAFLLDADQPHGLGNRLSAGVLQRAFGAQGDWDACRFTVVREHHRIDLLLTDVRQRVVGIIENKIASGEHGDQLQRYWETISSAYAGWRILAIYLSPQGIRSSHPAFMPLSYRVLAEEIVTLLDIPDLIPDTKTLLNHYRDTLWETIVQDDPDVRALCRQIYRDHKAAVRLLLKYVPDPDNEVMQLVQELLEAERQAERLHLLAVYDRGTREVAFLPPAWDGLARLHPHTIDRKGAYGGRHLFFSLYQPFGSAYSLCLWLRRSRHRWKHTLFRAAQAAPGVLEPQEYDADWLLLYSREIAPVELLDRDRLADLEQHVRQTWRLFLDDDLPQLDAFIHRQLAGTPQE